MLIGRIYTLADPATGEVRYCGATVQSLKWRLTTHLREARNATDTNDRLLWRWVRSLRERPHIAMLEEVDLSGLTRIEWLRKLGQCETAWIKRAREAGLRLLNATDGGRGRSGSPMTDRTKRALIAANTGAVKSAETREKMRQAKVGVRRPNQHGENAPRATISSAAALAIYNADWELQHVQLAAMHGTTPGIVRAIREGRSWARVTQPQLYLKGK